MSSSSKLVIFGKKPLPIGGVTIHVDRLCQALEAKNVPFTHLDPQKDSLKKLLFTLLTARQCHCHLSNPKLLLVIILIRKLLFKKTYFTLHSNLQRFKGLSYALFLGCIRWSTCPILLNEPSYKIAKPLNSRAILTSSFIPPQHDEPLSRTIQTALHLKKKHFSYSAITNAWDFVLDSEGKEIYGITDLIRFLQDKSVLLVISDPSGNYQRKLETKAPHLSLAHVFFISEPHSFISALKEVDCFIRNTTTDGDSLSIHEALLVKKPVWATDVITRPIGTQVYHTLTEINFELKAPTISQTYNTVDQLIEIYTSLG